MNAVESTKMILFKLCKNVVEKDHKGLGEELGGMGFIGRTGSKKYDKRDNTKQGGSSSRKRNNGHHLADNESIESVENGQVQNDDYSRHGREEDDGANGTGFNMDRM